MSANKKSGIPAMPVYAGWLRLNFSKHQYCGQASGGKPEKQWPHVEASTVRGLVGLFQKLSPPHMKLDGQRFALFGHDTGPFVPHICPQPDNALLSVTLMKSTCKWPFSATRAKAGKRMPCAFQQALIPYVYCYERDKKKKDDDEQASPAPAPKKGHKVEEPESKLVSAKSQVPGFGFAMIPTGPQTVDWRLGVRDVVLGVANVLVDFGFNYAWRRYHKVYTTPLRDRVALRVGAKWAKDSPAGQELIKAAFDKTIKDYAKGLASSAEVRAPLKVARLDLNTGKVTIWKKEVGEIGWQVSDSFPFDYPGWDPLLDPGNPVVDDLVGEVFHAD